MPNEEGTNEVVTREKKKARKTKIHYLPSQYDGRCQGTAKEEYLSSFVSYGGKLALEEVLHKFEMRLPIPQGFEELNTVELFNLTPKQFIQKGLGKLMTDIDEAFKKVLFKGIENPEQAHSVTEDAHLEAQGLIDDWRNKPRGTGSKSVKVSTFISQLVATGRVTEDDLDGVETVEQLFTRMAELGVQF